MKRLLLMVLLSIGIVIFGATVRAGVGLATTFLADWRFAHGLRLYAEHEASEARKQADANAKLQSELDHRGGK